MKRTIGNGLVAVIMASGIVALLTGCPAGGLPGAGGGGSTASRVDPNTCGNYAATDAGRKLRAFLEATVELDAAVKNTENYLRDSCAMMGRELGIAVDGDTRTVCRSVSDALREHMSVGLKAGAQIGVHYQPAVCTVNVDAAASAAAECQARATADVSVRCQGSCSGTCQGTCEGKCAGKAGTGGAAGQCNGECQGTCRGSCTGGCQGHAEVDADASCKAKAEVRANVEAKCTEPEVDVRIDAAVVVDKSKVDAAVRAIKVGLPRMLMVQAKMSGPVKAAFVSWSRASAELAAAGHGLVSSLGEQATCVLAQVRAAAGMLASIEMSISVQVEVSAEVSGSAGGGASAR